MSDPKHIKVKRYTRKGETMEIETESYYEKLAFRKIEYEKPQMVDRSNILGAYMKGLDPILLDGSDETTISIKKKANGKYMLVMRWTAEKEDLGKQ
jgi:hypothetical protein